MKKNKIMDFFSTLWQQLDDAYRRFGSLWDSFRNLRGFAEGSGVAALPFLENPAVFYVIDTLRNHFWGRIHLDSGAVCNLDFIGDG